MLMRQLPDELVLGVCERFFDGESTSQIADWLIPRWPEATREKVYPILREAMRREFLEIRSPRDGGRSARIRAAFPQAPQGDDTVVIKALPPHVLDELAAHTAEMVLVVLKRMAGREEPVHLGFGGGNTVKRVARHLSDRLRHEHRHEIPLLALHALGTGFAGTDPSTSAAAFFGFFHDLEEEFDIKYHLLLEAPFVRCEEYGRIRTHKNFGDCLDEAKKLDIVVTTLNNADHEHGLLDCFIRVAGDDARDHLRRAGWVGDVLWRPYSESGPITEDEGVRAVTVLELEDLVNLAARKDKHVFMVAGPCPTPGCNVHKVQALRPLLTQPTLKLFNHLVLDIETAEELLRTVPATAYSRGLGPER